MAETRQQRRAAEREKAKPLRGEPQKSTTPVLIAAPVSALLVIVILGLVLVKMSQGSNPPAAGTASPPGLAPPALVKQLATIPTATFDAVGYQPSSNPPQAINGKPLTQDGKPLMIYIGAEFCPYCAAERWPVTIALQRFGTFKNLGVTHSSTSDTLPNTQTFTFHGATYTSDYVALSAAETATNVPDGNGGYTTLDQPTQQQIDASNSFNSSGSIPFIDIANAYAISGASYDAGILQGMSRAQIAAAVRDPSSDISKAVLGTANTIAAAICSQNGGKPASVCASSGVTAAAAHLGK
jgi:hypothetical protein